MTNREVIQLRDTLTALQSQLQNQVHSQGRGREEEGSSEEGLREKKRVKGVPAPTVRQEEGDQPPGGSGAPRPQGGHPEGQPTPDIWGYFSVRTSVESEAHHIIQMGGTETLETILGRLDSVHFNAFERLPYRVEVIVQTPVTQRAVAGVCGRCQFTNNNVGRDKGRTFEVQVYGDQLQVPNAANQGENLMHVCERCLRGPPDDQESEEEETPAAGPPSGDARNE